MIKCAAAGLIASSLFFNSASSAAAQSGFLRKKGEPEPICTYNREDRKIYVKVGGKQFSAETGINIIEGKILGQGCIKDHFAVVSDKWISVINGDYERFVLMSFSKEKVDFTLMLTLEQFGKINNGFLAVKKGVAYLINNEGMVVALFIEDDGSVTFCTSDEFKGAGWDIEEGKDGSAVVRDRERNAIGTITFTSDENYCESTVN